MFGSVWLRGGTVKKVERDFEIRLFLTETDIKVLFKALRKHSREAKAVKTKDVCMNMIGLVSYQVKKQGGTDLCE